MLVDRKALKSVLFSSATLFGVVVGSAEDLQRRDQLKGIDLSYQDIDWKSNRDNGVTFAYIQATAGKEFIDQSFRGDFDSAWSAGILPGAYHFAIPSESTGDQQADQFIRNGGSWTSGQSLPGALYIEDTQFDDRCYGLDPDSMVDWVRGFSQTYNGQIGRYPVIYTTTSWWEACTKDYDGFGSTNPLWVAGDADVKLPAGWKEYTFLQYASDPSSGNKDSFNGDEDKFTRFVNNN